MTVTIPPDRSAGDTGHVADHNNISGDLTVLWNASTDILNVKAVGGAVGNGVNDDTTAINNTLNAASPGQVVYLPYGQYLTSGPLLMPPGVSLRGPSGAVQSGGGTGANYGAVIKPNGAWSAGGLPVSGVITLIDIVSSGSANTVVNRIDIRDLWIDGTSSAASVDGIAGWGAMDAVTISRVGVYKATGRGVALYANTNFTSANFPVGLCADTLILQNCGSDGFYYAGTDGSLRNIHSQVCTGDGLVILGANNRLFLCRGDLSANGFTFDASRTVGSANYFDACTLIGCGTQGNNQNGLNIINSSVTGQSLRAPVIVSGMTLDGDGQNAGSGGGGYAAISVTGRNNVVLDNVNVFVATVWASGGSPEYAIATASTGTGPGLPDSVRLGSGMLNAATALIHDAAPATDLTIAPQVTGYAGGQFASAATTPLQPVQTLQYLGGEQDNYTHPVPAVAATMPRTRATTALSTLTSGTLYVTAIGIQAGVTVKKATFFTNTTAKTGGTHGWYVLLDNNLKVIAVTADQTDATTVWGAVSTGYPLSFTASAITQYSGIYYAGVMVAETSGTMPTFTGATPALATGISIGTGISSPAVFAGTSSTGRTTPPSVGDTMSSISSAGNYLFYAYLE